MCTICNKDQEEFKCESCGELADWLTRNNGVLMCDDCADSFEYELQELITQLF